MPLVGEKHVQIKLFVIYIYYVNVFSSQVWTDYKYRAKRKLNRNLLTLRKAGVLSDDLPPIQEGDASDDQDIKCFAVLSPSPLDDIFDDDLPTVSSKRKYVYA